MRTKILKFGMPMMAFLLAIVFAFATEKNALTEDNSLVTGYIFNNGNCEVALKNCSSITGTVCRYLNKPVHKDFPCGTDMLFEWTR